MIWIWLMAGLFLLLLMFPILLAVYWYYHGKDSILPVRQDRRRDPRYFGKSFESLFRKAWASRKDGVLALSRAEKYLLADDLQAADYPDPCELLVVGERGELKPPPVQFEREIYAFQNARFAAGTSLRAVRTPGSLLFEKDVHIYRWADADGTVAVYDNCDLGISVTSGQAICVGKNCTFRRMYAPVIHLGSYPHLPQNPGGERKQVSCRLHDAEIKQISGRHVSRSDADENGVIQTSLVCSGDLVIDESIVVQGDVRSQGGVHLAENAVICGNLFAEGDLYLSRNSAVLGSVFTQADIHCEAGVVIGQENRVSSMIAHGHITTEEDCFVYGYISNERGGVVCPVHQFDGAEETREEQYLPEPRRETELTFATCQEFDAVDDQGFRHQTFLRRAAIPEGVKAIPDSMFFGCRSLETVVLPASLERIGEYAFADCVSLQRLDLSGLTNLRRIERSAFDGCSGLREILLPDGLEVLGTTAFANCVSLQNVRMARGGLPETIRDHCFLNCPLESAQAGTEARAEETTQKGDAFAGV